MARLSLKEKVQKRLAEAHIVKVIDHGPGKGIDRIADNFCRNKTKEDVQKILDRCGQIWAESCLQQELRRRRQSEQ